MSRILRESIGADTGGPVRVIRFVPGTSPAEMDAEIAAARRDLVSTVGDTIADQIEPYLWVIRRADGRTC